MRIYGNKQGSSTLTINGVDKTSLVPSSPAYFTITGVTEITSMAFNRTLEVMLIYTLFVLMELFNPLAPNGGAAATNFNPFNTDINTVRGQETGYALGIHYLIIQTSGHGGFQMETLRVLQIQQVAQSNLGNICNDQWEVVLDEVVYHWRWQHDDWRRNGNCDFTASALFNYNDSYN